MVVSIVVPCFNEEEVLKETYKRLKDVLEPQSWDHELIFVNDGSADSTGDILMKLGQEDPLCRSIHFSRNFGHQNAVCAGLYHATGDYTVIIDADLQDPPEVIPDMLNQMVDSGSDVIYGVRKSRKGEGLMKKATASLFYRLLNSLSEVKFPVDTGDFRIISRRVLEDFKNLKERNKYLRGLFSWIGYKQEPYYYNRDARFAGTTKYSVKKMLKLASDGLFSFSRKPLRIAIKLGTLSLFIGLVLAIWVFLQFFLGSKNLVPGWASTVIIIIFFGGVQLLSIGILGEYIGSIFDEVKGRPEYIVSSRVNCGSGE